MGATLTSGACLVVGDLGWWSGTCLVVGDLPGGRGLAWWLGTCLVVGEEVWVRRAGLGQARAGPGPGPGPGQRESGLGAENEGAGNGSIPNGSTIIWARGGPGGAGNHGKMVREAPGRSGK